MLWTRQPTVSFDPTTTATISLGVLSATLLLLFFILAGASADVIFLGPGAAPGEAAPVYFASAILGYSLGLMASVVRFPHAIRSIFTVVMAGPFVGILVTLLGSSISLAFASPVYYGRVMVMVLLRMFVDFFIFSVAFSSCAGGGCISGCIIQERSKRWAANPTLPPLATAAVGITGCAAALASTFRL